MRSRARILTGFALVIFMAGLAYGILGGDIATSATADDKTASESLDETSADPAPGSCLSDPSVLQEIRAQRESISKTQKELAAKEAELKTREQAIADEMKKLVAIRDEIGKTDALKKKDAQEKVAKIIETLETMSPKASAKMLAELDDSLAVEVLTKMDTTKLAKIMNLLEPKRASKLTEILAGVDRARVLAPVSTVASADRSTGRDAPRNLSQKGGDKYDGQNNDSSKQSSSPIAKGDDSSRKPASVDSQAKSSH